MLRNHLFGPCLLFATPLADGCNRMHSWLETTPRMKNNPKRLICCYVAQYVAFGYLEAWL